MDALVPDLAQHSSASLATSPVDAQKRDEDARAEEVELKQLADRVSAARCVV
jgi:hypothetical protein